MKNKNNCIILLSGGLDSAVMLKMLKKEGYNLHALSIDYGQRHKEREFECAEKIAQSEGVPRRVIRVELDKLVTKTSLINKEMDTGDASVIVPNRNMIMLSLATALAIETSSQYIAIGVNASDYEVFPDCREEFLSAVQKCIAIGTGMNISVLAPLLHMTKTDIVKVGSELGVDFSITHTCYNGEEFCGTCLSCLVRKEAFEKAGVQDPLNKKK
jgi:7-cyano-7-deazaguanine synthase